MSQEPIGNVANEKGRRLSVAILCSFPGSLTGFRWQLLQELHRRGVDLICIGPPTTEGIITKISGLNARYYEVELNRTRISPYGDLRLLFRLYRLFKSLKPDVVFAYTAKPVIYGGIASYAASVRRRCSMITGLGYYFVGQGHKELVVRTLLVLLYRLSMRRNSTILFQNQDDHKYFLSKHIIDHKQESRVVPGSGVDLEHFYFSKPIVKRLTFCFVGRLLKSKGIQYFVEAVRLLLLITQDVRFLVVGGLDENHPDSVSALELAEWSNIQHLSFLGWRSDIREYLRISSVFVLPSFREGHSRACLEAMSIGRAIVTTDTTGCREMVVHGKNGFLVPVGDAKRLAYAMERFMCDPELIVRMGKESRRIAVEKYDGRVVNREIAKSILAIS